MILKNNWFVCDFETVTENTNYFKTHNDTKVLLADSLNWETGKHNLFTSIEEWWNFHSSGGVSQTLFFHNLSFDGTFILPFLSKKYRYNNSEIDLPFDNSYEVFRQGSKIYRILVFLRKTVGGKQKRFKITILCSLRLLNASIQTLGKTYNREKHLLDDGVDFYDLEPQNKVGLYPQRFIEYIKNDTEVALMSLKDFEEAVLNLEEIKLYNLKQQDRNRKSFNVFKYLTAASLTKQIMKFYVNNYNLEEDLEDKYLFINSETHSKISPWFRGGVAQVNTKYTTSPQPIWPAVMIDVTSAYPYQMTFSLPFGEMLDSPPEGDFIEFLEIDVQKAKLKKESSECVFLHNWKKDNKDLERFKKVQKRFKCFYIRDEWDALNKFYDFKVSNIKSYYMKATPFLAKYSQSLFEVKNKYASLNNDGLKQAAKILLNAGYGCLATRQEFQNYMYFEKDYHPEIIEKLEKGEMFYYRDKNYVFNRVNELFNFNKDKINLIQCLEDKNNSKCCVNKAAAAVITAKQRVYLYNKILEIGCEHFLMSDTDSILFGNLPQEKYQKLINESSKNLGDWEVEKTPHFFGSYGAKKYVMFDENKEVIKLRFAGVSENIANLKDNLDFETFQHQKLIIDNAVFEKIYCPSGIIFRKKLKEIKKGTF